MRMAEGFKRYNFKVLTSKSTKYYLDIDSDYFKFYFVNP